MTNEQAVRQQLMGRRILTRRERVGLSQDALGKRVGVSRATVEKWESGASAPRWPTMWTLGEALGVSPRWLVEPLVVDVGEVQTGGDDPGPGASSSTTRQGRAKESHANDPSLAAMIPAKPTVGGPPLPGGSHEQRIDHLERRTDRMMDLLLRLRREVRAQRR